MVQAWAITRQSTIPSTFVRSNAAASQPRHLIDQGASQVTLRRMHDVDHLICLQFELSVKSQRGSLIENARKQTAKIDLLVGRQV
jgi:predicted aspartyl protease